MTTTVAPRVAGRTTPIKWAPALFVAATAIGVVMRLIEVGWKFPVPFDHLLHSHSHALYFGWAGLVILSVVAGPGQWPVVKWSLGLVLVMSAAFLWTGYAPASIAASAAVMGAWYVAMLRAWRSRPVGIEGWEMGVLFAYVLIASLGIAVLGPVQALDIGPVIVSQLAIHAFLSTFAWFFVIGSVVLMRRSGLLADGPSRRITAWLAGLAWATFPTGVVGGPEVAILGPLSRIAAIALLYPAWLLIRELWSASATHRHRRALRSAAIWLALAAVGLAGVGIAGTPVLLEAGRHGIVFYLHALLLGYVTTVLIGYLTDVAGQLDLSGALDVHTAGVALMLVGLGMAAGGVIRPGLWVAAAGAVVIWLVAWVWARNLWSSLA